MFSSQKKFAHAKSVNNQLTWKTGESLPKQVAAAGNGKVSVCINDGESFREVHFHRPIQPSGLNHLAWVASTTESLREYDMSTNPFQDRRDVAKRDFILRSMRSLDFHGTGLTSVFEYQALKKIVLDLKEEGKENPTFTLETLASTVDTLNDLKYDTAEKATKAFSTKLQDYEKKKKQSADMKGSFKMKKPNRDDKDYRSLDRHPLGSYREILNTGSKKILSRAQTLGRDYEKANPPTWMRKTSTGQVQKAIDGLEVERASALSGIISQQLFEGNFLGLNELKGGTTSTVLKHEPETPFGLGPSEFTDMQSNILGFMTEDNDDMSEESCEILEHIRNRHDLNDSEWDELRNIGALWYDIVCQTDYKVFLAVADLMMRGRAGQRTQSVLGMKTKFNTFHSNRYGADSRSEMYAKIRDFKVSNSGTGKSSGKEASLSTAKRSGMLEPETDLDSGPLEVFKPHEDGEKEN